VNIEEYLEERRKLVDEALKKFVDENYSLSLRKIVLDIIKGGKRIRGCLCLLVCEALDGKVEDALDGAVAVELMHSASLAFDDIIDMDFERRGEPAAWLIHRFSKPIIAGNLLVSHGLTMLRKYGEKAIDIATKAWHEASKGVGMEVFGRGGMKRDRKLLVSLYEKIVSTKTASVFAAAGALGAVLADRDQYIPSAAQYGKHVGVAFQIADDAVELMKNERGVLGSFIAYVMKDRDLISSVIKRLEEHTAKAVEVAEKFPPSKFIPLLQEFPDLAVKKMLKEVKFKWEI